MFDHNIICELPTLREWIIVEDSPKGYIPRGVAEALLGRSLSGTKWFSKEEEDAMRLHQEWMFAEGKAEYL